MSQMPISEEVLKSGGASRGTIICIVVVSLVCVIGMIIGMTLYLNNRNNNLLGMPNLGYVNCRSSDFRMNSHCQTGGPNIMSGTP